MNKAELISTVANKVGISKKQAGDAVECIIDTVVSTLKGSGEVALSGFGTFSAKKRASRIGINPKTMEKITIPAITAPKFKAGKGFKEALRKG